jgi:hypothetical protein
MFFQYYSGFPFDCFYISEGVMGSSYNLRLRPRGVYYRANGYWDLGLRFQQSIDVRKGKIQLDVQAQNVLNNRAPDNYFGSPLYADNRLSVYSRQDPMRLQFGVSYEF